MLNADVNTCTMSWLVDFKSSRIRLLLSVVGNMPLTRVNDVQFSCRKRQEAPEEWPFDDGTAWTEIAWYTGQSPEATLETDCSSSRPKCCYKSFCMLPRWLFVCCNATKFRISGSFVSCSWKICVFDIYSLFTRFLHLRRLKCSLLCV